jgi:hypothetical protein
MRIHRLLLAGAVVAGFLLLISSASASAQEARSSFRFRSGQSLYIAAYRDSYQVVVNEASNEQPPARPKENYLDLERKIDEQLRKWNYFNIVDRPADAEVILLVYTDVSSMEGIAVSQETYRLHFKEKFDLDQLRDASFARATAGPLNIATLSRLSERMIKQLRWKIEGVATR